MSFINEYLVIGWKIDADKLFLMYFFHSLLWNHSSPAPGDESKTTTPVRILLPWKEPGETMEILLQEKWGKMPSQRRFTL